MTHCPVSCDSKAFFHYYTKNRFFSYNVRADLHKQLVWFKSIAKNKVFTDNFK